MSRPLATSSACRPATDGLATADGLTTAEGSGLAGAVEAVWVAGAGDALGVVPPHPATSMTSRSPSLERVDADRPSRMCARTSLRASSHGGLSHDSPEGTFGTPIDRPRSASTMRSNPDREGGLPTGEDTGREDHERDVQDLRRAGDPVDW
jgi:hypothetical protein